MPTVLDSPVESQTGALPLQTITTARLAQFSVERYHQLIASGHFTPEDRFELLEGYLVTKMSKNWPHLTALRNLVDLLPGLLPNDWQHSVQDSITMAHSEPEPDLAVIRRQPDNYYGRVPGAADAGLLIEVADSSLDTDQIDKLGIYARAGIPVYWIVNLIDRQIEVYERPAGSDYQSRRAYLPGEVVPIVLAGQTVGHIAVNAVLPAA